jgi:hypothetical protein
MKLTKATKTKFLPRGLSIVTTTMMLLAMISLQTSFQGVQGAISCDVIVDTTICKTDNSFLCDVPADGCQSKTFTGVEGTTSKCFASGTDGTTCDDLDVEFSDTETDEQSMTCEGKLACDDVDVYFGDASTKATMTCKGGDACYLSYIYFPDEKPGVVTCSGGTSSTHPACTDVEVFGGCLICDGPHSCLNVCANIYVGIPPNDNTVTLICKDGFYEGSIGINCPKDKKASLNLPTCFSGANTVEVLKKGLITTDALEIGDLVKTGITHDGQSEFSRVISSVHVDPHAEVKYHQIFTNFSPSMPLEITGDHFLYLYDDKVIRARDVQVGDTLKGDADTDMVVTHIQSIQRQGLYAPATENGKIWVSGVMASSYIALMDDGTMSPNMQIVLSHMALSPLRMVCTIGSFSICQNEAYSEDGYSMNLWTLIQFGHHFVTLSELLQLWMLMAVAPLLMVVGGLEVVLHHGMWASVLMVGLVVMMKTIKTKTLAKK